MVSAINTKVWDTPSCATTVIIKIRLESVAITDHHPDRRETRNMDNFFNNMPRGIRAFTNSGDAIVSSIEPVDRDSILAIRKASRANCDGECRARQIPFEPIFADCCSCPGNPQGLDAGEQIPCNMEIRLQSGYGCQAERNK